MGTRRSLTAALLIILAIALLGCAGGETQPAQVPTAEPAPPVAAPAETPQPDVVNVRIIRYTFAPQTVEIKAGDKVRWVNEDGTSHSIKLLGSAPSPILAPGQDYAMTFSAPGTYQYSCGIHPKMQGTVVVR